MAEAAPAPAEGVALDPAKTVDPATTADGKTVESEKPEGNDASEPAKDDAPVTQKDLRRVLKSKDHWKERALRLEGELNARREEKQPEAKAGEPQAPKREDFATYEEFIEAKAEFKASRVAEERFKALEEARGKERAETEENQRAESWLKSADKAREKYEDYDEVTGSYTLTPHMARSMAELGDVGTEINYFLGQHPEEAERIAKLSPYRQAAEIGKLEVKLAVPPKKTSKAPPPIDPVRGKSAADDDEPKDSDPPEVWRRKRDLQVQRQRGGR
jgi:hypothetical protein